MGAESCRRRTSRRRCHAAALLAAVLFAAAMANQHKTSISTYFESSPAERGVVAAGRPIRFPAAALARWPIDSSSTAAMAAADVLPARRRWLVGPGSSPPTCRARCGRCTPCRATRVAIQPGVGPQWEYYPEVWRCKCGNKLFMP